MIYLAAGGIRAPTAPRIERRGAQRGGNIARIAAAAVPILSKDDLRWSVVVINENGTERWRANVPATFNAGSSANNRGFVAISDHRVVLSGQDNALLGWDAATGKPIG